MILKLYIRNLWELSSLLWPGTSREMCGQNLSLFLGQEVIAHRWNLQWGWAVAPPRVLSKSPFHGLHSIITSGPQAPWRTLLLAGPFSFSSTAFTFSWRTAPWGPLGLVWALIWQRKGRRKYMVAYKIELLRLPGPLPQRIDLCALKDREVPVSQA